MGRGQRPKNDRRGRVWGYHAAQKPRQHRQDASWRHRAPGQHDAGAEGPEAVARAEGGGRPPHTIGVTQLKTFLCTGQAQESSKAAQGPRSHTCAVATQVPAHEPLDLGAVVWHTHTHSWNTPRCVGLSQHNRRLLCPPLSSQRLRASSRGPWEGTAQLFGGCGVYTQAGNSLREGRRMRMRKA